MNSETPLEPRRYTRIQTRLAIAFAILAAVIALSITVLIYWQVRSSLYAQFNDRVLSLVTVAKLLQQPNLLSNIKSSADQDTAIYRFIEQENSKILGADPTLGSIYVLRQDDAGNLYYVFDTVSGNLQAVKPPAKYGDAVNRPLAALKDAFATLNQPMVESSFFTDSGGTWLSAYAPIIRDDGTREGMLGIDLSATAVLAAERNLLVTSIILLAFALPVFAGIGWVVGRQLARPIVELNNGVKRITSGDMAYRVEVKSGDEIEALADSFNTLTARVNDLLFGLEQRVEERTSNLTQKTNELEEVSRKSANRAAQLTAVSVVARTVTTVRDVNVLLPSITAIISQQFGYYHIGIFLNDAYNQYAVLRAANSEGGKRMLDQGHRLRIGKVGIVGNVASTGKPRIALDTGEDVVFFNNPNLPSTKSEMALPLKVGEKIMGVMDVQSTESAAFGPEDVEILSILADQVSIAIENANLFAEAQKSTAEAQSALRQYARSDWGRLQRTRKNKGYRYTPAGIETLTKPIRLSEKHHPEPDKSVVKIPLTIRDEQIGSLGLLLPADKTISEDEMDIARAIAERVALSVENARLFEETSSRAEREKAVADISNKIRSTNDPEIMIQTALRELQNALGASKVQILPYSASPSQGASANPKKARKTRAKSQE